MTVIEQLRTSATLPESDNGLDSGFVPAALWIKNFTELARQTGAPRTVLIDLLQAEGKGLRTEIILLPNGSQWHAANVMRTERHIKTLLWMTGGWDIRIDGADEIIADLQKIYGKNGARAFDNATIGEKVYGHALCISSAKLAGTPKPVLQTTAIGGHHKGNRIGFDLGGSDRKCAAVIDGKVVFSEEVPWSPYFESDPNYHFEGIADSLRRAAAHLPQVDCIGGSAAGVYVENSPRIGSLFRGVSQEKFDSDIRPLFFRLKEQWGNIPFEVANDGDVSALAGAAMVGDSAVLGISMGTSLAAGYVDRRGSITGWLNELAFVPVDYRENAPADEWSGDIGCGVQYFSQQAVQRLAPDAGLVFSPDLPAPQILEAVQGRMKQGDARARAIFETIGTRLAHSLPYYALFYEIRHVLLLGRVLSGEGGNILMDTAKTVLEAHYPDLKINWVVPDESFKRHGQAVIAATLPALA